MIYIYITFDSATKAIQAESVCDNIPGTKIVPLRPEIDAGCGLALRSDINNAESILSTLKRNNIQYSKKFILDYTSSRVSPIIEEYFNESSE